MNKFVNPKNNEHFGIVPLVAEDEYFSDRADGSYLRSLPANMRFLATKQQQKVPFQSVSSKQERVLFSINVQYYIENHKYE